jgi:iron complex outermembrane receptor protein
MHPSTRRIFALSTALPAAVGAVLPGPAIAQNQLEEIVVTAERRAATELTSALSIEVLTGDDLARGSVRTVMELQNAMPNITIADTGGATQSVNIRGIGNSVVNPNIQPGVAVFQDGLIMAETIVIQSAFLDVGTVEVLRGPQGTFVGQSSTGGAIRINSALPSLDDVTGYFEGVAGNYRNTQISGAINVPLSDRLAARFAFSQESADSFYDNLGDPGTPLPGEGTVEVGAREDSSFRASVLWQPSESFSVLGRIERNATNRRGTAPYQPNPRTYANPLDPTGIGRAQYADFGVPGPFTLAWDRSDATNTNEAERYSVDLRKTFDGGMEFRSLTGYQHNDTRYIEDFDGTIVNGNTGFTNVGPDNDYYSQEFNLLSSEDGRFSWILGSSWFHRTTPVNIRFENNNCGYNASNGTVTPCPPIGALPATAFFLQAETVQRHAGLFGQMSWNISDALELEIGARNSWDNNLDRTIATLGIDTMAIEDCPVPGVASALPAPGRYICVPLGDNRSKYKNDTPTYKVGLNWTPSDGQFIYLFYARGYKSGGVNNGLRFEEEIVDDYEIGWKAEVLDGRMQVQVGAFDTDYTQMQQSAFRVSTTGNSANNQIQNLGDSRIRGVEFSLNAAFGNLGLNFTAGYTDSDLGSIRTIDARFLDPALQVGGGQYLRGCASGETPVPGAGGAPPSCYDYSGEYQTLSGADNVFTPELSYNFALDYGFELRNGATIRPRIAVAHIDSQFTNLFQEGNYFMIDERDLTHVSVTYERDAWTLQAFCNNCSDEIYVSSVAGGGNSVVYGDPKTAGVRFNLRF